MNSLRHYPLTLLLLLGLTACSGVSDERPQPLRKSEYYLEHGVTAFEQGDYLAASDFFNKALAHYRSIDNVSGTLLSHINLAETAIASGNFTAAVGHIDAAEELAANEGITHYRERLQLIRAQTAWHSGERSQAQQLLDGLLPAFDEDGQSTLKPTAEILGATILRTDIAFSSAGTDLAEARLWLQRLSRMMPAVDGKTPQHQARLLRYEAQLARHEGDTPGALAKLQQALDLYRNTATRPAIAATLGESGELLMESGQWQEAEQKLRRALYIRLWLMDRKGTAEVLEQLKAVYLQLGNEQRYEELKRESERLITQ